MIFSENKNKNRILFFFAVLLISSGIFFLTPSFVNAKCFGFYLGSGDRGCFQSSDPDAIISNEFGNDIKNNAAGWVKEVLYALFVIEGYLASVAVTIFEWAANPDHISGKTGVLNRPAIYEMWQFIRDFFNLFFILVLLYIAFTVVFQIQKNFKQMILSLIIAALLINFSFPISRFIIDATNVPMYFFANQMMGVTQTNTTGRALGTTLSATKLMNILIPPDKDTGEVNVQKTPLSTLLMAIIFLFIFSITLLVLGVMFVIRLIALMLLVVFSSAGFAAAIIPGMDKYSKMWWDNFWKYALFGPAAMFMLLIAVKFFVEISNEKGAIYMAMKKSTEINSAGDPTYLASLAMFSAPIILLWFAIGLGQTMALAGGATISGYGHKFAAWAGKKASGYSAIKRNFDSYVATRKKLTDEKNKGSWGASLGKTFNKAQDTAYGATIYGVGLPGSKAARQRVRDMQNKEISEKVEEHKKNQTDRAILADHLKSKDAVKKKAAALALAEHPEGITEPDQLGLALAAVSDNMTQYAKVLKSADADAMNMSVDEIQESVAQRDANGTMMRDSTGRIMEDKTKLKNVFSKMKTEGQAGAMVDYRASEIRDAAGNVTKTAENRGDVVLDVLKSISSAKDKVKQGSLFRNKFNDPGIMSHVSFLNPQVRQELEKVAAQESQEAHRVISGMPTWNSSSSASSSSSKPKTDFSKLGSNSPKFDDKTGKII